MSSNSSIDTTSGTRLLGTVIAKNCKSTDSRLCFLLTESDARAIRDMLSVDLRDGKYADGRMRSLSFLTELTFVAASPES